jgi:hypothetical protein
VSSIEIVLARRQWEEGSRRLDEESRRDPRAQQSLLAALEVVVGDLRKRVGQTYSLGDLTDAYEGAENWVREAIEERAAFPGWPRSVTTVQDAAFHLYSRGATDYTP